MLVAAEVGELEVFLGKVEVLEGHDVLKEEASWVSWGQKGEERGDVFFCVEG